MYNSPKKGPKTTNNFYNPKTTCIKIGSFLQETKEKNGGSKNTSLMEGTFHQRTTSNFEHQLMSRPNTTMGGSRGSHDSNGPVKRVNFNTQITSYNELQRPSTTQAGSRTSHYARNRKENNFSIYTLFFFYSFLKSAKTDSQSVSTEASIKPIIKKEQS